MRLGVQDELLHQQQRRGKAPAGLGLLWPPRAHLGGLSSLEGWGLGAVALVKLPCLHHRVTLATMVCVSQAVQVAGLPLAQDTKGPRPQGSMWHRELPPEEEVVASHLAGETPGWAGP